MNKIKELRKEKGLTQIELAKMLNITQGTMSGYENERYTMDPPTLAKLADLFGTTIDDILGYTPGEEDIHYQFDGDRELWELREEVRQDPDRYELFCRARTADIGIVRQVIAIMNILEQGPDTSSSVPRRLR